MPKSWGKVLRIYNLIQYPWGGFEIKSKTRVYNNIIIKSCVYVFNNFNLVLQNLKNIIYKCSKRIYRMYRS